MTMHMQFHEHAPQRCGAWITCITNLLTLLLRGVIVIISNNNQSLGKQTRPSSDEQDKSDIRSGIEQYINSTYHTTAIKTDET